MKRTLTIDDATAAVWGGAILGGGGGGHIDAALRTASLAIETGSPEMWSVDEFDRSAITATVALVGAPSMAEAKVTPADALRSLELLCNGLPDKQKLAAINSNENGAETTINGWFHSAITGLPVLDLACNGRAHPTSLMGSLGLHLEPDYVSIQGFAGGAGEHRIEGMVRGTLSNASTAVRNASIIAGGFIAASRNPVSIGYASDNGAPGAISAAIELGKRFLDGGVTAVVDYMDGRIVADGMVTNVNCDPKDGLDVGQVQLDDAAGTVLLFVNEYILLEQSGSLIASFPDLIVSFSEGSPVISADIRIGMRIQAVVMSRSQLLLSRTMHMSDLYRPLRSLLGRDVCPDPP